MRLCIEHKMNYTLVAEILNIDRKRVKYWYKIFILTGSTLKNTGGRPCTDPEMETKVLQFIYDYVRLYKKFPKQNEVRSVALRESRI